MLESENELFVVSKLNEEVKMDFISVHSSYRGPSILASDHTGANGLRLPVISIRRLEDIIEPDWVSDEDEIEEQIECVDAENSVSSTGACILNEEEGNFPKPSATSISSTSIESNGNSLYNSWTLGTPFSTGSQLDAASDIKYTTNEDMAETNGSAVESESVDIDSTPKKRNSQRPRKTVKECQPASSVGTRKRKCHSSTRNMNDNKRQKISIDKDLRKYLQKKTTKDNPHMNSQTRSDLIDLFRMRKQLTSNESLTDEDMSTLEDLWLDTYRFRFHELHNVVKLSIAEILKVLPGYAYFPLLKDDFTRDTRKNLDDLKSIDWTKIIKPALDSRTLIQFEAIRIAKEVIGAATESSSWHISKVRSETLQLNIGMTFLLYTMLRDVSKFVVVVESLDRVGETFGKDFMVPTIVIVNDFVDFCNPKEIFVFFGGVMLDKVSDLYTAVIMCYALYYVFWLDFDENSAPVFESFNHHLQFSEDY